MSIHVAPATLDDSLYFQGLFFVHLFAISEIASMAPSSQRRLAKNDLVLVTGANGYIATHIVDTLLSEGYRVRGTVRGEKPWLNQLFDQWHGKGRFESISVPNLDGEGVYDEAMKGASGVVCVVSCQFLCIHIGQNNMWKLELSSSLT